MSRSVDADSDRYCRCRDPRERVIFLWRDEAGGDLQSEPESDVCLDCERPVRDLLVVFSRIDEEVASES